ncbi:sigma-70 family RNA polymerase sigma factor [Rhodobaculum claviforme]|uniref:RNA polymerase sigma factor n=1 Tax=Rhodobaculum claviforme TaxID=1549854 RepID=A0A934TKH4_9RHOB|nr:sigma-70 family RNA polymerase sigma factor [Rhodobaculum claviforme]MBK5927445.1 hypothetical protein [Rhodobaculum claviforme]
MTPRHPFHLLLPQHFRSLGRRALHLTRNEHRAQDLVQETLLKAWAARDSYRPETNLGAWLFTIMRNAHFSDWRKRRREVQDVDGAHVRALAEEPTQDHVIALRELISAIARLPQAQQRPVVLMGAYGFTLLETADACGCAVGTIKSRVSRGRATLQHVLAHDALVRTRGDPPAVNRPARGAPPRAMLDASPTAMRRAAE